MKQIIAFLALFLGTIGLIAGFGYCVYLDEFVPAVGVLVLGAMAFPQAKKYWHELVD